MSSVFLSMLNISQVIIVRTDSNLCRKELTVHWSAPNSLIRAYLQPCTNTMWGGWKWSCGSHYLIIPDCGCPKGGSFLSRSSHNSPELCQRIVICILVHTISPKYLTGFSREPAMFRKVNFDKLSARLDWGWLRWRPFRRLTVYHIEYVREVLSLNLFQLQWQLVYPYDSIAHILQGCFSDVDCSFADCLTTNE